MILRSASTIAAIFALAGPAFSQPPPSVPPPAYVEDCSGLIAQGVPRSSLWQGYFSGTRTGASDHTELGASRAFCFPSPSACEAWLRDMRVDYSLRVFRDECLPFVR